MFGLAGSHNGQLSLQSYLDSHLVWFSAYVVSRQVGVSLIIIQMAKKKYTAEHILTMEDLLQLESLGEVGAQECVSDFSGWTNASKKGTYNVLSFDITQCLKFQYNIMFQVLIITDT